MTSSCLNNMVDLARCASRHLAIASTTQKNAALRAMAEALRRQQELLLDANVQDLKEARASGLSAALQERLTLNESRIEAMAAGLEEIATQCDPIGQSLGGQVNAEGLEISRIRVPLGVIAMIYESRPNVTADAAGLCLKSGNAVILRGGSEATSSNKAIARCLVEAIRSVGLHEGAIQLFDTPGRGATEELIACENLDLLIPRGGKGLKKAVQTGARAPFIMTGMGVCHIFLDESADLTMARAIVMNAKTQRPSVCNAVETVLIHRDALRRLLPALAADLQEQAVELRGDDAVRSVVPMKEALPEDWDEEYLDLVLSIKAVDHIDEAMEHIERHSTGHSEAIVTSNYVNAEKFLRHVDAAAVYVNASTRFTDGGKFGLGAEMGISTQKLHARGPIGVEQLTSTKYIIRGQGQVRS